MSAGVEGLVDSAHLGGTCNWAKGDTFRDRRSIYISIIEKQRQFIIEAKRTESTWL